MEKKQTGLYDISPFFIVCVWFRATMEEKQAGLF
jgi:hypothetical protein